MYTNETTLYIAILIAVITIGAILIYFTASIVGQQKRYRALNKINIEIETNAIETERRRIAQDIHDELAIKLKISSIDTVSATDEDSLNQSLDHLNEIIKRVRDISNHLMPAILTHHGPVYAIQDYINQYITGTGLDITVLPYRMPELSHNQQIHIFRILQEIIHNTVKHANAQQLKIQLLTIKNNVVILTCDDGKGFNYYGGRNINIGLGLRTLQTRTDILGGEMYINSRRGKGTRIHIEFPINLKISNES